MHAILSSSLCLIVTTRHCRGFNHGQIFDDKAGSTRNVARPSLGTLPDKVAAFRSYGIAGFLLCFLLEITAGQRVKWYTFAKQNHSVPIDPDCHSLRLKAVSAGI